MTAEVTILIPNYKTPIITKLCLRLLRQNTDLSQVEVIAIDNHSQDESLGYLKSLGWIKLIERIPEPDDTPPLSHARALDLALAQVTTPYVLSIHNDTFVRHPNWLPKLLAEIKQDPQLAGVGSWKLEEKPWHKQLAKGIEYALQTLLYGLIRKKQHALVGQGNNFYYLRSHLALYRMDLIRKHQLAFCDGNETAGKIMHKKLVDLGYKMKFLTPQSLLPYVIHLNHATIVLNPELGGRPKTLTKGHKRINRILNTMQAHKILENDNLDTIAPSYTHRT